jgi:hypothetical protein
VPKIQTITQSVTSEQVIVQIVRKLPPERVSELVNFARFLEFQTTDDYANWVEAEDSNIDQADTGDAHWDELFARPQAKQLMRQMANEAREDYRAGRTTRDVE